MVNSIRQKDKQQEINTYSNSILTIVALAILFIVCITILQDLLESNISNYPFHLSESLLFKTTWFLFIPILSVLHSRLRIADLGDFKIFPFIILPIIIHLLIVPFIAAMFSTLFFEGRYDLYKFFYYIIAHDLYKLVSIYTVFVLCYRYFQTPSKSTRLVQKNDTLNKIVVNNGKDNTIISSEDILQITAATPYIFIHVENKKHLHSETLKSICCKLDSEVFIRVHKSTVVNIEKVTSFKSRLNGDYDIQLFNGEIVRLSRTYVPDFKKRFISTHQDNIKTHQVER